MGEKNKYEDHKGNKFDTMTELCNYWGKVCKNVKYHLKVGKSLEEILEPNEAELIICKNKVYKSISELGEELKINPVTIFKGLSKGSTLDQIYDRYTCDVEIDGKIFTRLVDLANYTDISTQFLINNKEKGNSYLEIIREELKLRETLKMTGLSRASILNQIREGETHQSIRELNCINYKLEGKYFYNLKSLSEELRMPIHTIIQQHKEGKLEETIYLLSPITHNGILYNNHREMLNSIGNVSYSWYKDRLREGIPYNEALIATRINNRGRLLYGVKLERIVKAHNLSLTKIIWHNKNYDKYILNKLLWKNFNFLGFTEDGKAVYRKSNDGEIVCTSFEEYISYLERESK